MLKNRFSSRKGATLIELYIVMALISIISVMVVSFIALINARVDTVSNNVELHQELKVVESAVQNWSDTLLQKGATFSDDGKAVLDGNEYSHDIVDNVLFLNLPDNLSYSCPVEQIKQFSISTKTNGDKVLFICTAYYFVDTQIESITFTVCPFVGTVV